MKIQFALDSHVSHSVLVARWFVNGALPLFFSDNDHDVKEEKRRKETFPSTSLTEMTILP